ncbi:phytoene/squalene synthase family protein [Cesiribacter andamanensis]|uniref:Squalene synthase HpnD n=1 Tax=Cesiribacter andamanensis AMV16 TaxID=1279009 RepID=M7NJ51_9BACT|nr:phytoene/squalene synthase family protein [Cesiribacter andamanensis]EMR01780.1 squalene synthase HpnD [Cesiribacter andamanensis AMV16]
MDLFSKTTFECSKLITQRYSTSFTLGIRTLHKRFHFPIYAIYGYVRYADEIVDTFHSHDKARLLERFRHDTRQALDEKISLNPVLHSFQQVVHEYGIEWELIEAFLHSMEMDLDHTQYERVGYEKYIYGSAEVVGLMCLRVFCEGDEDQYQQLKAPARSLGAAFQKVNFLRDIRSDFEERGRVYFPGVDFTEFTTAAKKQIEKDIEQDFADAYSGILRLPKGAQMGVYLAYLYYKKLFYKICSCPPSRILKERVRIPDQNKLLLLAQTMLRYQFNIL